jgi:hypothetical protein
MDDRSAGYFWDYYKDADLIPSIIDPAIEIASTQTKSTAVD